jgi:hypothetical protein
MGGKRLGIEPGQRRLRLDDLIDGAWLQCPLREITPAIDLAKNASRLDAARGKPGVERFDRPAGEIDDLVVIGARGLRAAEMDGKRGQGRGIINGNGRLGG